MPNDQPDLQHLAAIISLQQQQDAIMKRIAEHMQWEEKRYTADREMQDERHKETQSAVGKLRDKIWYILFGLLGASFSAIGYLAIEGPPWVTLADVVTAIEHHRYELHQR